MASRPLELGTQRLERVTGIEPALSAWESDRSGPLTALTWALDAPLMTVMDPVTLGLMARQWPMASRLPAGGLLARGRLMTTMDVGARPMARRPRAGQYGVCRVSASPLRCGALGTGCAAVADGPYGAVS